MLEDNFLLPLFEVIQYTVIFISSFVLMIYFDIIVTICVVAAIAVMILVPSLLGGTLEKKQNMFSSKLADFTANLKDILSGFEIIKSYSMVKSVIQRFDKVNTETINSKYSVDRLFALNEGLSAFLALMVQIVVLFLSAYFIITGRITVGTLLGMVQVSSNLANPLIMIFTNVPKMKSVRPIVEKLENMSKHSLTPPKKENIATYQSHISAKDLSFSYIKLLSGYYSTYAGEILYDDTEYHMLDKDNVVQLSSIIHQNIYMFDETIYDNICLHEHYPEERIEKVIADSGLTEFISELPTGLQYQVGENGSNLSGGQKQRIAVARALIRNKPILILDEGTSAIDMQTAYDIENRLLKMEDLTLITITHHLEPNLLDKYDEIFYMQNGCIKEKGCFKHLINTASCFSEYFHLKK